MDKREAQKKRVLDRIESIEAALVRAREYLESGKHAHWSGFRPLFVTKEKRGKELPPHNDWVQNVFLPSSEKALISAEKALERINKKDSSKRSNTTFDPTAAVPEPRRSAVSHRSTRR